MDPWFISEREGFFPDSEKSEKGADYLRRIKHREQEESLGSPGPTDVSAPPAGGSPEVMERRRSPRIRCSGSAEFRVEGSDIRMWGTLSDISLHGCYIEMNNTFPVNTRVSLVLEAMGVRVQVPAVVRVSYPFLGMGMSFTDIEPEQRLQLKRLLAALSAGDKGSNPISAQAPAVSTRSLADVDPNVMLDALTDFFHGNQLLSREEFYQIANRSRR